MDKRLGFLFFGAASAWDSGIAKWSSGLRVHIDGFLCMCDVLRTDYDLLLS
jgi:hypothetical protein